METKVTREIIRGGTVVLTEELPHLLTASVGFWINFGSRAEEEAQYGASHFIEHMLFKGTERMGPRDLALAIESVGGSIGAAASEEKTYCNARVLPEHLPIAVSIISDMFGRSQFPDAEFAREKEVVLEEIKAHEDTPEDLIYDLFLEDIYGREGLGHNPLGYEDTIKAMTRDDLFALYRRYYRPAHLIVSVAGNLGGMNIPELVARELEPCVEPACNILGHKASISDFTPKIKLRKKDTGQVQFCLGAPGVPFDSPDRFIYMALDVILSGGMSSRLFQEVRERRGLVYDISSSSSSYRDSGCFVVAAGTRPENLSEVVSVVVAELSKIKNGDIALEELERVKEQLRVSMSMSFESVTSRMMKLASSEMYYGRNLTDEEIFEKIRSVTLDELMRIANEAFQPDRLVFSALGPFRKNKFKSIEKQIFEILNKI